MHRATLPVIFIIYVTLFFLVLSPMKEGKIPVFDFSLFIMILIFWISFFILRKNIFDPLLMVLKERDDFVKKREEIYEKAMALMKKNQEEYDREIQHFREKERQKFFQFSKELKEKQNQELENFKKELEEKMKVSLKNIQKEKEEAKNLIEKNVIAYSKKLAQRILKKDVA